MVYLPTRFPPKSLKIMAILISRWTANHALPRRHATGKPTCGMAWRGPCGKPPKVLIKSWQNYVSQNCNLSYIDDGSHSIDYLTAEPSDHRRSLPRGVFWGHKDNTTHTRRRASTHTIKPPVLEFVHKRWQSINNYSFVRLVQALFGGILHIHDLKSIKAITFRGAFKSTNWNKGITERDE